jgi:hypothetical protein
MSDEGFAAGSIRDQQSKRRCIVVAHLQRAHGAGHPADVRTLKVTVFNRTSRSTQHAEPRMQVRTTIHGSYFKDGPNSHQRRCFKERKDHELEFRTTLFRYWKNLGRGVWALEGAEASALLTVLVGVTFGRQTFSTDLATL